MDKLLGILKDVAPALATVVAGPLGGAAVGAIADKLGLPEKTVEAVTTALTGNPANIEKLKELELEQQKVEAQDRDSARNREIEMVKAGAHPYAQLIVPILASGTVGGAFLLTGILFFIDIPDSQENIIIFALGFISSSATQVLSYYFGSSQSSKDKTEQMMKDLKK
jgi:hypothetical protein